MVGAVQHQTARARQSLVGPEGSMATGQRSAARISAFSTAPGTVPWIKVSESMLRQDLDTQYFWKFSSLQLTDICQGIPETLPLPLKLVALNLMGIQYPMRSNSHVLQEHRNRVPCQVRLSLPQSLQLMMQGTNVDGFSETLTTQAIQDSGRVGERRQHPLFSSGLPAYRGGQADDYIPQWRLPLCHSNGSAAKRFAPLCNLGRSHCSYPVVDISKTRGTNNTSRLLCRKH